MAAVIYGLFYEHSYIKTILIFLWNTTGTDGKEFWKISKECSKINVENIEKHFSIYSST